MATTGELRVRAYYIWEAKGWPGDSALSDWLEAESAAAEAAALAEELSEEPAKPAPRKRAAEPAAPKAAAPAEAVEAKKAAPRSRKKATTAGV